MKRVHFIWVIACALLFSVSAQAKQTLEYTILKEGDPIGKEVVEIVNKGEGREVTVKTETDVHLLFLQFHYRHERTETWKGDQLVAMVTKTNDDGSHHSYRYAQDGGKVSLVVDDQAKQVTDGAFPMSLWHKSVVDKKTLLSVIDGEPYQVQATKLGENHYKIDGDITRELWFAEDGYLKKAAFNRKGFFIEFLRK